MTDTIKQRADEIRAMFRERFGSEAELTVQAPGRVNLIGEHTDYNDGFVFPMAIDRSVMICGRRRADRRLLMHQPAMAGTRGGADAAGSLDQIEKDPAHPWANYILGVARELLKLGGELCGAELTVAGNVPIASGLSSSAAIEVATATFFEALCGLQIEPREVALLCQRAENGFVGVNCGIMDQFISKLGRAGHALMLDCRSLDYRLAPLEDPALHVVVADTAVKRGLVDSAYNARRAECEQGVQIIAELTEQPIRALRDVSVEAFGRVESELADPVRKRCRHVVTENQRTLDAAAALEARDFRRLGHLLNASHVSLRDDYEVSCDALDLMCDLLRGQDGMLGARMTGAGFGGCAIGVMREPDEARVARACERVARRYRERTGLEPSLFTSRAAAGAGVVET